MGLMQLIKVLSTKTDRKNNAPGNAIIINGEGLAKSILTAEAYQQPGIYSNPPEGTIGVFSPIGESKRYGVVIAMHNYKINITVDQGETVIYSTDSTGATVMSQIKLDKSGNIDLNGNSKKFVTHSELNTALQNFVTALNLHTHPTAAPGPVSPPSAPMSINISSAATSTVRTGG